MAIKVLSWGLWADCWTISCFTNYSMWAVHACERVESHESFAGMALMEITPKYCMLPDRRGRRKTLQRSKKVHVPLRSELFAIFLYSKQTANKKKLSRTWVHVSPWLLCVVNLLGRIYRVGCLKKNNICDLVKTKSFCEIFVSIMLDWVWSYVALYVGKEIVD